MLRRYPFSVDAGPAGASLLRFSNEVFAEIAGAGREMQTFSGSLFQVLRDKLLINIFRYVSVPLKSEHHKWARELGDAAKGLTLANMQRIARGLMYCATQEADDLSRATDGSTLFLGCKELRVFSGEEDMQFVNAGLKLFDRAGLIRWYGGKSGWELLEYDFGKQGSEEKWKEWRKHAFEHLVARPLASQPASRQVILQGYVTDQMMARPLDGSDAIMSRLLSDHKNDDSIAAFSILLKKYDGGAFWKLRERNRFVNNPATLNPAITKAAKETWTGLKEYFKKEVPDEALVRWFANLAYVDTNILHGSGDAEITNPHVIRIISPHDLRRLALDGNEFDRLFADRLTAFPHARTAASKQTLDFLQVDHMTRYNEIADQFLRSVWESSADCYMTGSKELAALENWVPLQKYVDIIKSLN